MKSNILSFAGIEDMYSITYQPQESFTVHLQDRNIIFYRRDKLYMTNFGLPVVAVMKALTKAVEARSRAYEPIRNAGYPSYAEVIYLIQDGNFYTHANAHRRGYQESI
jgi:hypothetical protein